MQTYELLVRERSVIPNSRDVTLVRTSVGIDRMHVMFDSDEWLGFPVTVTFGNGDVTVTDSLPVAAVDDSEWSLEGECVIPHEVIEDVGPIRVTFQGTDSEGRHIITAAGSPLRVEEAGDVAEGGHPSEPTVDQWQQAYAEAVAAANDARTLVENLQARLDDMVAQAREGIEKIGPATRSTLGTVMIGDGVSVDAFGTISVSGGGGSDSSLRELAEAIVDEPFVDGEVNPDAKVRPSALPKATLDNPGAIYPDGVSILIDENGMLSADQAFVANAMSEEDIVRLTPFGDLIPDGDGEDY